MNQQGRPVTILMADDGADDHLISRRLFSQIREMWFGLAWPAKPRAARTPRQRRVSSAAAQ